MTPRYYLLRAVRYGPLVPARLRWLDHAPEDPETNKLDRGRLSIVVCADIAGTEVEPEQIMERLWSETDFRPGILPGHWRYPKPITEAEYHYQVARLRWAEAHRPEDAALRARRAVDPAAVPIPSFEEENA